MSTIRSAHYCDHCDKSFTRAYILRDHINSIRGIKAYNCSTCSTRFSRRHDLKVHQTEQHSLERPSITCRIITSRGSVGCDRVFERQSDLLRHLRAPAGQYCRLSRAESALVVPDSSQEIAKAARRDYVKPSSTSWVITNDPQSGNLLDQNQQVNWYQRYLTIRANAWIAILANAKRRGHDAPLSPQLMTDLIHVTRYFAKKGCSEVVVACAQTLFWATNKFEPEASQIHLNLLNTTSMLGHDQYLSMVTQRPNIEHDLATTVSFMNHLEERLKSLWTDGLDENEARAYCCRFGMNCTQLLVSSLQKILLVVSLRAQLRYIHTLEFTVLTQIIAVVNRIAPLICTINSICFEVMNYAIAEGPTILATMDKVCDLVSFVGDAKVLIAELSRLLQRLARYAELEVDGSKLSMHARTQGDHKARLTYILKGTRHESHNGLYTCE